MRRRIPWRFTCLAACLSIALSAPQQNPPPTSEIRGFVLEAGTNQPIVDAEISLSTQTTAPVRLNGGWTLDENRKTLTDFSGAFRLALDKPGAFRVEAKKAGYFAPGGNGASNFREVKLTAESPVSDVKLYLVHPGKLSGHVVDAGTGEPVAKVSVRAVRTSPVGGFSLDGTPGTTNAEGDFAIDGLAPGDYAVEVRPQMDQAKRVATQPARDPKVAEPDYEHTYWPGGHDAASATPVTVTSGATVHIGKVAVRKVAYHVVHLRVPPTNCGAGETVAVAEHIPTSRGLMQHGLGTAPCGKDLYVGGFSAGEYRLALSIAGRSADTAATAYIPFTITAENITLDAPLTRGVAVEGVFMAEDGAKPPDVTRVSVGLRAVDGFIASMPVKPAADGQFRIEGVRVTEQGVLVAGLGAGSYVKEIRYNGAKANNDVIALQGGALVHKLSIVIDDKPGSVIGSVMSGDKPVGNAIVIARKWPASKFGAGLASGRSDESGRFRIGGLTPGEYRVIAVRTVEFGMDAAVAGALEASKKVEVGVSAVVNLQLEVTELR